LAIFPDKVLYFCVKIVQLGFEHPVK
jgi:hypothetical protein